MTSSVDWPVNKKAMTLSRSDPRLEALDLLFQYTLEIEDRLVIQKAQDLESDEGDYRIIQGEADTWGHKNTAVTFTYNKTSGRVVKFELTKDIDGLETLELPKVTITDWQQALEVTVPNDGAATVGIMSHQLSGIIKIDGTQFEMPFIIDNPVGGQRYLVEIDFEEGTGDKPQLTDLAGLMATKENHSDHKTPHQDDLKLLPDDLKSQTHAENGSGLDIGAIKFQIDPTAATKLIFVAVRINIFENTMWEIVPQLLSVGDLWVSLEIDYPLESYRFPIFTVGGTIQIGPSKGKKQDGQIEMTARWPDLAIQGRLAEGQVIHIKEMLAQWG